VSEIAWLTTVRSCFRLQNFGAGVTFFLLPLRSYREAQLSKLCKPSAVFLSVLLYFGCITSLASDAPTPWTAPHFTIDPKFLYE